MQVHEELLAINWPSEFLVEYTNGEREWLLRGDGVSFTLPNDDPEGCGGLSAQLPKRHPRNQKTVARYIPFTELCSVFTVEGLRLWPLPTSSAPATNPPKL